jgi:thiol:disulfide interchange protein DsbC
MRSLYAFAAALTLASGTIQAQSADLRENDASITAAIKKTFLERYPGGQVVHIVPSVIPGLYEIYTGTQIVYSDRTANYLVVGSLVDTRTKRDLTESRNDELNSIDFQSLPFEHAIKVVKGNGSRKLAVFSDPDCPFCKRLEKELIGLTDVTVYTFLYPLQRIHPKAAEKAHAIWCSDDRAAAWTQWMLEGKEPAARTCEGDPTDQLVQLGGKLKIEATPTLYLSTGARVRGMRTAQELAELLTKSHINTDATTR